MVESTRDESKWCPFEVALVAVKEGYAIQRDAWKNRLVVRKQDPDEHSKMTASYLYIEYVGEKGVVYARSPWTPTNSDIMSEDWMLVE